jgi:hypothetical protein
MKLIKILIPLWSFILITGCATRAPQKIQWIEEALLHDGRIINVTRTTKTGFDFALIRLPETRSSVSKFYGVEAINPNTGEVVSWESEEDGVLPVLIDFDSATTYLVVYISDFDNSEKKFGCVFPPYIFLKHQQHSKWVRVNQELVPKHVKLANLTYVLSDYDKADIPDLNSLNPNEQKRLLSLPEEKRVGFQTVTKVKYVNCIKEKEGYFFQIEIPRNISELKTKKKVFGDRRKFMPNKCKEFPDDM